MLFVSLKMACFHVCRGVQWEQEKIYKEMEHLKRENLLFDTYVKRVQPPGWERTQASPETRGRNKREKEPKELTWAQKFEIATIESDQLKFAINDGQTKSDAMLETLRAILEETDMSITEIRKDAFDFQREILIGGENSRTGKIEAERIVKYREEKLRQKDAMIEKYKSKKGTLEGQICKLESSMKKKEEMGDDLKFIDFHQLQIENKKYVKEIEDKNNKLKALKSATGNIVAKLNQKKTELNTQLKDRQKFEATAKRLAKENMQREKEEQELRAERSEIKLKRRGLLEQKTKMKDSKSGQVNFPFISFEKV